MSTSQNGFPALSSGSPYLHKWVVPGAETSLLLRNGSAGFLLIHLATRFDRKIEGLHEPVLDDWGYAYRAIRGYTTTLSNHASGTAEDLNATDHPLGVTGTFSIKEIADVHNILTKYEGCIRWGGDYTGRKDSMHFEINKSLSECEKVARKLLDSPVGAAVLAANPGQKAVILS